MVNLIVFNALFHVFFSSLMPAPCSRRRGCNIYAASHTPGWRENSSRSVGSWQSVCFSSFAGVDVYFSRRNGKPSSRIFSVCLSDFDRRLCRIPGTRYKAFVPAARVPSQPHWSTPPHSLSSPPPLMDCAHIAPNLTPKCEK